MQHPPLPHVLPAQQRSPGSPHDTHVRGEVRLQLVSAAVQTLPAQHGCPAAPQAAQVPL